MSDIETAAFFFLWGLHEVERCRTVERRLFDEAAASLLGPELSVAFGVGSEAHVERPELCDVRVASEVPRLSAQELIRLWPDTKKTTEMLAACRLAPTP